MKTLTTALKLVACRPWMLPAFAGSIHTAVNGTFAGAALFGGFVLALMTAALLVESFARVRFNR